MRPQNTPSDSIFEKDRSSCPMSDSISSPEPNHPKPWQPRFGIGALLLVMLVFCVLAAGAGYLVQGLRNETTVGSGRPAVMVFLLFTLAGPMLLMVVVSIVRALTGSRSRRRRK